MWQICHHALSRLKVTISSADLQWTFASCPPQGRAKRRLAAFWGIGVDGVLNNVFKRTLQEGLWFIAGGLAQCRMNSKYLALQIKAMELGKLGPLSTE